jgi:hypothetical protein
MKRRGTPEADIQRSIVAVLRTVLPRGAVVHHSANEITGGSDRDKRKQAMLVGMGVFSGFSDLVVISGGIVAFLEVKSKTGPQSDNQSTFQKLVEAQGFTYALVRSVDDAIDAVCAAGIKLSIRGIK